MLGQEFDAVQLTAYKKLSADDRAYGLALAYATRRLHSRYELTQYFRRKDYGDELSEWIMQRLEAGGLVDDGRFTEAWVHDRRLLRPISKRRLVLELRQKRVADDVIERVFADDQTDERAILTELIVRKRKQTRYRDDVKLMQYLVRQGFSYDDVKSALTPKGW